MKGRTCVQMPKNLTGNILKLGDFGISRILSPESQFASTAVGTPFYLSELLGYELSQMQYSRAAILLLRLWRFRTRPHVVQQGMKAIKLMPCPSSLDGRCTRERVRYRERDTTYSGP
jgi:serine/threonine protein kinase